MQIKSFLGKAVIAASFIFATLTAQAQVEGKWFNQEKSAHIEIFKMANGKVAGKITYLKEPNDESGKPKTDPMNPNEKMRSRPRIGMVVVAGFDKKSETYWDGGTIYDPKTGKTYSCNMTLQPDGELKLRGYIGISLIGKTQMWTRVK